MPHKLFGFALVFAALAAPFAHAQSLEKAFTYQGRLDDGGNPAHGSYDLQFSLHREESGGSIVAGPVCSDDVDVQDGLFTALVDFGADVFNGEAYWLEIEVRADATPGNCATGGYSVLAPRQVLTSAPKALFALDAETAYDATLLSGQPAAFFQNASNLTAGTIPDGRLSGTYSGALRLSNGGNAFTGSFTGDGAGLTGLNADLFDGLDSSAFLQSIPVPLTLNGANGTHIIRGENTSTSLGASGVHGLCTAGIGPTSGVLGQSASPSGRGVFGEATAATGTNSGVYGHSASTSGRGVFGEATAATGTCSGVHGQTSSTSGRGVYGEATAATGTGRGVWGQSNSPDGFAGYFTGIKSYFEGSVGIGTGSPDGKLNVVGGSDAEPGSGGYIVAGPTNSTNVVIDNNEIMARDDGATAPLALNGDGGNVTLIQNGTGNVGIGTTAPQAKLHVDGNTRLDGTVFIAPIRRWLTVHYSAFNPGHTDVEVRYRDYLHHLSCCVTTDFVAPVQLPDGADIISMTAYLVVDLPGESVSLELRREPLVGDDIVSDVICAVSASAVGAGSQPFADTTPDPAFDHVDNNLYAYSLYALIPYQFYGVKGVVIEYEIDRPLP